MKIKIVMLVVLLFSCASFPEKTSSQKDRLINFFQEDFNKYLVSMNEEDWDSVLAKTYQKIFTISSRDELRQAFESMKEMGLTMKSEDITIINISGTLIHEDEEFCLIKYRGRMIITLDANLSSMITVFAEQFRDQDWVLDLQYDEETRIIKIALEKTMIAIRDIKKDVWGYIEENTGVDLSLIFSSEVLEKLEQLKSDLQ